MDQKQLLRARLRKARREHFATLPEATRRLLFLRPPAPIAALVPEGSLVGIYHAAPEEAPTRGYAQWLYENGRKVALPWFGARDQAMLFRLWSNPFTNAGLERGPHGALQPAADAEEVIPALVFVPLLGFTSQGDRLGQGGGHYDRWLADHPDAAAIGLAWDCQLVDTLPHEPHDRPLRMVVTPTRFYEGAG